MAARESIKITCKGAATIAPSALQNFQGELKSLTHEDFLRLKKQIVDLGFSEPISVWKNGKNNFILNGHQRLRTVQMMVEEGYECPPLPVSIIQAKSKNEAKRKLLAMTSVYGKVEGQGLYEYLHDADIAPEELFENYKFADFDIPSFTEEFFFDKPDSDSLDIGRELDTDAANDFGAGTPSESHVRMVQLFFNETSQPKFLDMAGDLQEIFKTDNLTDTVMEAVRYTHEKHTVKVKTRKK